MSFLSRTPQTEYYLYVIPMRSFNNYENAIMKHLFKLLIVSLMFGACSSESPNPNYILGGYSFREIFLLDENTLKPAHGSIYDYVASGSDDKLVIISYGITKIESLEVTEGIEISAGDGFPVSDKDEYDSDPDNNLKRYCQTLRLRVSENTSNQIREAKFRIISGKYYHCCPV